MRPIVLSLCIFAAACSGLAPDSPTSPTTAMAVERTAPVGNSAHAHDVALLFRGEFTGRNAAVFNCPPTCPPTSFTSTGTHEGTSTQLGRFTATTVDVVDIASATATGTMDFTAANGDRLHATTVAEEESFMPPNIGTVRVVATVTGGTGRFAGATGTFTVRFTQEIDFANATAEVGSGSLDGVIRVNK